ncbi:NB-ARC domain protein [Mycoavidus cysteinexigens]|uniref:NB-ARC domain protein n=1 Tax=Mycoavidus cysteinexigens TaxID=1553431 RepID=A0A2Z6EV13_9BURK|nr:pentapeptide repeat-containing protein [Mycoavidus cysteinexigens]BBE09307.1 NB-ARC domain protein [Mycoavidus cysteinexigens]GAM51937.1 hypothetical protein EBME_0400 [bacterium endosymbiont of Mortierella elongata FMR23-6]GLR02034.1 hypothetical protein GCM10007934_18480 [Mycoavidus cysteinexigens]
MPPKVESSKLDVNYTHQKSTNDNFERGERFLERARECRIKGELNKATDLFSKAKEAFKEAKPHNELIRELLGTAYLERGDVLLQLNSKKKALDSYEKAKNYLPALAEEKLANLATPPYFSPRLKSEEKEQYKLMNSLALMSLEPAVTSSSALRSNLFFFDDSPMQALSKPPAQIVQLTDIIDTQYLAGCLQQTNFPNKHKDLLMPLAKDILEIFAKIKNKMFEHVLEMVPLATIPDAEFYRHLINQMVKALEKDPILNLGVTQGLAVMIRNCPEKLLNSKGFSAGDLVAVLNIFQKRLNLIHRDNNYVQLQSLLEAFTQLLDAMVQTGLERLNHDSYLEPLNTTLDDLASQCNKQGPTALRLTYQICYARQALAHISNTEDTLQATLRNTFKIGSGLAYLSGGVIKAIKLDFEPGKFVDAFQSFKAAWDDLSQKLRGRRNTWYFALQYADLLLEAKQWAKFEDFVLNNSDHQNKNFLLGVCQRLERIARSQTEGVRDGAIRFLKSLATHEEQEVQIIAQDATNRLVAESEYEIILPTWSTIWQTPPGTKLLKEAVRKQEQDALWQFEIVPFAKLGKNNRQLKKLEATDEIREARELDVKLQGTTRTNTSKSSDLDEKIDEFLESEQVSSVASAVWGELSRAEGKVSQSALLNRFNLVKEPTVLKFLVKCFKQESRLEKWLLNWVERSKIDENYRIGAANALTILVKAGIQFNRSDFNGIKVPGADLSYGVFDNVQFKGANLNNIMLHGAWLFKADMRNATLSGAEFGETPALDLGTAILACSYSSDGRWLAVSFNESQQENDYHIKVYETKTRECKHILKNPEAHRYNSVAFSPNGEWLVSGDNRKRLSLWEVASGKLLKEVVAHRGGVNSVVFSSNNQWLASGSFDKTIKLWAVQKNGTFTLRHTLEGHSDAVLSVSISPDGKWLASGSKDQTIKLWNLERGQVPLLQTLGETNDGHRGAVLSVCFSPDGAKIASGGRDKTVKLWSWAESGVSLSKTLEGRADMVSSVAFSLDGKRVVAGGLSGGLTLWNIENSSAIPYQRLDGHSKPVSSVCFLPDGTMVSGALDGVVKLWPLKNIRNFPYQKLKGHSARVTQLSFSPQGGWLASASGDKTVKLWKLRDKKASLGQTLKGHEESVSTVSISPDGQSLVSGDSNGMLKVWKRDGSLGMVLQYEYINGATATILSNDKWLTSSGEKIELRTLAGKGQPLLRMPSGHSDVISSLSSSEDGELLVSASFDQTVKLWSLEGGKLSELYELEGHDKAVHSVSIAPNCDFLASGGSDGKVMLWKAKGKKIEGYTLKGHGEEVYSVSISPDNKWVVSGGMGNIVKLWSAETGHCEMEIQADIGGYLNSIVWLEAHQDSMKIALAGEDTAIRIFQLEKKEESWKSYLWWTSYQNKLSVDGLSVQGARGLSTDNANLLRQKGAIMQLH